MNIRQQSDFHTSSYNVKCHFTWQISNTPKPFLKAMDYIYNSLELKMFGMYWIKGLVFI